MGVADLGGTAERSFASLRISHRYRMLKLSKSYKEPVTLAHTARWKYLMRYWKSQGKSNGERPVWTVIRKDQPQDPGTKDRNPGHAAPGKCDQNSPFQSQMVS